MTEPFHTEGNVYIGRPRATSTYHGQMKRLNVWRWVSMVMLNLVWLCSAWHLAVMYQRGVPLVDMVPYAGLMAFGGAGLVVVWMLYHTAKSAYEIGVMHSVQMVYGLKAKIVEGMSAVVESQGHSLAEADMNMSLDIRTLDTLGDMITDALIPKQTGKVPSPIIETKTAKPPNATVH